jgi:hypothetical protein
MEDEKVPSLSSCAVSVTSFLAPRAEWLQDLEDFDETLDPLSQLYVLTDKAAVVVELPAEASAQSFFDFTGLLCSNKQARVCVCVLTPAHSKPRTCTSLYRSLFSHCVREVHLLHARHRVDECNQTCS